MLNSRKSFTISFPSSSTPNTYVMDFVGYAEIDVIMKIGLVSMG